MGEVAPCQNITAVYHPRKPTDSPLYHLLQNHFEHFEQIYDDKLEKDYGFYRQVISDVVYAYLKCGDLKEGFARIRCPDCHYEYLLAFSCRGRWSRSLVPRLPVQAVTLKRLCNSVKCYVKIYSTRFHTANMFSVSRSFCVNSFSIIVIFYRSSPNAQQIASWPFFAQPLVFLMVFVVR